MTMENRFKKYLMYEKENGKIINVNPKAFELADESFLLFKSMYDTHYGSIKEDENLVSIHTGGWSDNEELIEEFKQTAWWFKNHKITAKGGHYYFDTDFRSDKEWNIVSVLAFEKDMQGKKPKSKGGHANCAHIGCTCNHTIGWTTIKCCNHCGKPIEDFWTQK